MTHNALSGTDHFVDFFDFISSGFVSSFQRHRVDSRHNACIDEVRIINCVSTWLTSSLSGHGKTAVSPSSLAQLKDLHHLAQVLSSENQRSISILPGSGINSNTVQILLAILVPLGLQEIHMSGGRWLESEMEYRREDMGLGTYDIWQTDEQTVAQVRQIVDKATTP